MSMFKQHLEMIGRNEPVSKKAKFWQSYIRSLKGSDDIRAQDGPRYRRPLSSIGDYIPSSYRSIYETPSSSASERITVPGYRYMPVHRETYGYSPRPIYTHNYSRPTPTYSDWKRLDADRSWNDHMDRMADIERRYPSRYGLYLKDKPSSTVMPLEYEPEDKPSLAERSRLPRATSVPPMAGRGRSRELSMPRGLRASSVAPLEDFLMSHDAMPFSRAMRSMSPTPIRMGRWAPRPSEVAYDSDGLPIFTRGGLSPMAIENLINPSPLLPLSSITRDPWWHDLEDLRPFRPYGLFRRSPSHLRDSFLSPVKRSYLWDKHPVRPFAHVRGL